MDTSNLITQERIINSNWLWSSTKIGDRGYSAFLTRFNYRSLVHIRKMHDYLPKKGGIALTITQWNSIMRNKAQLEYLIMDMQETLKHQEIESKSYVLDLQDVHILITEHRGEVFIHIQKLDDQKKPIANRLALNLKEWQDLEMFGDKI